MDLYPIYDFDYFDQAIGENNSYASVLSKKYRDLMVEKSDGTYWQTSGHKSPIDSIIKYSWDKDDIDSFIDEYPECIKYTFFVYSDGIHKSYNPLQEKRDKILNDLIK